MDNTDNTRQRLPGVRPSGGKRAVYAEIGLWHDERTGAIHVTLRSRPKDRELGLHTAVFPDPDRSMGHPDLYDFLRTILVSEGRFPEEG